jgi:SAM-dependent methyltransferase
MVTSAEIDKIIGIFNLKANRQDKFAVWSINHMKNGHLSSEGFPFCISADRKASSKDEPSFLEIGCGFGSNTLKAALLGYDAIGVDIRERYVDVGNELIGELKAGGIIDPNLSVRLFYGNFMDKGTIRWYKENWAAEASRILKTTERDAEEMLASVAANEFDILTRSEFMAVMESNGYAPVRKLELLPTSRSILDGNSIDGWQDFMKVSPQMILANPYESEEKDVYDVMGKSFGEFDAFYIYPYGPEYLPLYRMLYEDHPSPFTLYDCRQGIFKKKDINKKFGIYKMMHWITNSRRAFTQE